MENNIFDFFKEINVSIRSKDYETLAVKFNTLKEILKQSNEIFRKLIPNVLFIIS